MFSGQITHLKIDCCAFPVSIAHSFDNFPKQQQAWVQQTELTTFSCTHKVKGGNQSTCMHTLQLPGYCKTLLYMKLVTNHLSSCLPSNSKQGQVYFKCISDAWYCSLICRVIFLFLVFPYRAQVCEFMLWSLLLSCGGSHLQTNSQFQLDLGLSRVKYEDTCLRVTTSTVMQMCTCKNPVRNTVLCAVLQRQSAVNQDEKRRTRTARKTVTSREVVMPSFNAFLGIGQTWCLS